MEMGFIPISGLLGLDGQGEQLPLADLTRPGGWDANDKQKVRMREHDVEYPGVLAKYEINGEIDGLFDRLMHRAIENSIKNRESLQKREGEQERERERERERQRDIERERERVFGNPARIFLYIYGRGIPVALLWTLVLNASDFSLFFLICIHLSNQNVV